MFPPSLPETFKNKLEQLFNLDGANDVSDFQPEKDEYQKQSKATPNPELDSELQREKHVATSPSQAVDRKQESEIDCILKGHNVVSVINNGFMTGEPHCLTCNATGLALSTHTPEAAYPTEKQGSGWISVEERLPDIGVDPEYPGASALILLSDGEFTYYGQYEHCEDMDAAFIDSNGDDFSDDGIEITHWMPLPDAPAPASTEKQVRVKEGDRVYTFEMDGTKVFGTLRKNYEYPHVSEYYVAYDDGHDCAVLDMNLIFPLEESADNQ